MVSHLISPELKHHCQALMLQIPQSLSDNSVRQINATWQGRKDLCDRGKANLQLQAMGKSYALRYAGGLF